MVFEFYSNFNAIFCGDIWQYYVAFFLHWQVSLVNSLEEETGVNPGWINNGGIFIANNKERLDEYQRLGTIAKAFDIETYVLDPQETKKVYPLMNVDDVYGTLYSPADGTIDPNGLCQALTRSATRAGAKVVQGCVYMLSLSVSSKLSIFLD